MLSVEGVVVEWGSVLSGSQGEESPSSVLSLILLRVLGLVIIILNSISPVPGDNYFKYLSKF